MPEPEPPEIQALRKASAGLMYPSESDVPFDVFRWETSGSPQAFARDAVAFHVEKGRAIEEIAIEPFFSEIAGALDPHKLSELRRTLQTQLSGLRIFRVGVGEAEVDIYLLGQISGGYWAGLHTRSVET